MNKIIRKGMFYRVLLSNGKYIAKQKFLRKCSAIKYENMLDKNGSQVEEYKGKDKK